MTDKPAQSSMTIEQISRSFQERAQTNRDYNKQSGMGALLETLSTAVRDMQEAGLPVALELRTGQYSNAYDMLFSDGSTKRGRIGVYGFLHIGDNTRLLAIVDRIDSEPVLKLHLSEHTGAATDSRIEWSSPKNTPSSIFDFGADKMALAKLQAQVIEYAAAYNAIMEHDVADVFNQSYTPPGAIKKPLSVKKPLTIKKPA